MNSIIGRLNPMRNIPGSTSERAAIAWVSKERREVDVHRPAFDRPLGSWNGQSKMLKFSGLKPSSAEEFS